MAISRLSIVKFVELALTCSCVALHYYSFNPSSDIGMLVTGTFVGYLIIFAGAAAGYIMQTPSHKRIDIFYSLVGVALFVASGAVIIDNYQHAGKGDLRDKNLAKASLAIINGAVLLLDAVLTQRGG
ncbi:protein snakeskin-like [Anticarsia gemmatalis]|uniref:protein snakeskin-like n=1 Tax=Anticarsia gemmatalis TaxID=129554 RepID=UPI003F770628